MKIRTNALAGIALAATAALGLAACGSGSSATAGSSAAADGTRRRDHGLQRPARDPDQGVDRRVHRSRPASRSPSARATTPRCPTRSCRRAQASPADVFLTENSPAMAQVENAGLFADVDKATARPGARRVPPVHRQVDRHRGPLHRPRLRQAQAQRRPAAQVDARPRQARVEGPLGRVAVGRRLPGHRLGAARAQGRGRHRASG